MDNTHLRHARTHSAIGQAVTARLHPQRLPTKGWYWKQTHWDNYVLTGPIAAMRKLKPNHIDSIDGPLQFSFRDYGRLCFFCGTHGINATQV